MKKIFVCVILFSNMYLINAQEDFKYYLPEGVSEDSLINIIINNGGINEYKLISLYYFGNKPIAAILPYSLIMANKWNYPPAMLEVYQSLLLLYNCSFYQNIEVMDKKFRNIALEYLIMYYENANEGKQKEYIRKFDIPNYIEKGYLKEQNGKFVIVESK